FLFMPLFTAPTINPQLIIVPALFIVSYLLSLKFYSAELSPATENVRARFGGMNTTLSEAIDGIETVKGASQEAYEIGRFGQGTSAFRDAFVRQSDIEARFIPLLLLGIANGSAFVHALILQRAGLITIGNVVAYMGYLQLFGFPTWVTLFAFSQVSLGFA